jgi:hypothetical protein
VQFTMISFSSLEKSVTKVEAGNAKEHFHNNRK